MRYHKIFFDTFTKSSEALKISLKNMFKWRFNGISFLWQWWNKYLVTLLKRNFNKKWWLVNEELLHTLKRVLSAILFNEYLGIRITIGIDFIDFIILRFYIIRYILFNWFIVSVTTMMNLTMVSIFKFYLHRNTV